MSRYENVHLFRFGFSRESFARRLLMITERWCGSGCGSRDAGHRSSEDGGLRLLAPGGCQVFRTIGDVHKVGNAAVFLEPPGHASCFVLLPLFSWHDAGSSSTFLVRLLSHAISYASKLAEARTTGLDFVIDNFCVHLWNADQFSRKGLANGDVYIGQNQKRRILLHGHFRILQNLGFWYAEGLDYRQWYTGSDHFVSPTGPRSSRKEFPVRSTLTTGPYETPK